MRFRQHERTARHSTLRLMLLFGLVVLGLLGAVNGVLALIYKLLVPFASGYPTLFFETNSALVLLFVLGGCWVETMRLREGGAHVARMAGGREAQLSAGGALGALERRFANTVQEMAIAAGHATAPDGQRRAAPAVWVLPKDDAINAFAAGWGADDAVIAVTRGSLERLTRAELQGVVAHEFSHLVHGDTRLNMRLVGLVWGLQMVWGLGVSLWEPDDLGRRNVGAPFGLGLMAVGSLGWAAGRLLQAAVSRQREFLADASAVKYTRAVDGLGGALRKIAEQQMHGRAALASAHTASLAHLLLAHRGAAGGWRALWHTHPPLAERLRRLYGREVLPLAAPVLAVDANDAEPLMASVALVPSPPSPPSHAHAASATSTADALSEAERHDALQNPASFDALAREQEALARVERWHGPGEWQAAMLALAIPPPTLPAGDGAASASSWAAWQAATADIAVAAGVRQEIEALGPAARRRVFELLVQRACSAPHSLRRALHRSLRRRWQRLPAAPSLQWRALALALLLSRPAVRRSAAPKEPLPGRPAAAHAATLLLSQCLGASAPRAQAWRTAAAATLAGYGAAAPRGPGLGLAPATQPQPLRSALRLRQLSAMQRPLLLRAWLLASASSGLSDHAGTADALHLACLLLELPVPQALVGDASQLLNL